uniref:Uncharacterized protein n=2 Tax=Oryza TaxID=4527 RepID=A0A0E0QUG2_ORYRU
MPSTSCIAPTSGACCCTAISSASLNTLRQAAVDLDAATAAAAAARALSAVCAASALAARRLSGIDPAKSFLLLAPQALG